MHGGQYNANVHCCSKVWSQQVSMTVFNIDTIKRFSGAPNLHIRLIFYTVTLKAEVKAAEKQLCYHRNKLHFKVYSNRKQSF